MFQEQGEESGGTFCVINNVEKTKKANNCQTQIKEIARDAILRAFLPDLYVRNNIMNIQY